MRKIWNDEVENYRFYLKTNAVTKPQIKLYQSFETFNLTFADKLIHLYIERCIFKHSLAFF